MSDWDALTRLLQEERTLLIEGRLTGLMDLSERKIDALRAIGTGQPAHGVPDTVRNLAERNARLLEAAGRGIKSAIARLEEVQSATMTTTYDAQGTRHSLTPASRKRGSRV